MEKDKVKIVEKALNNFFNSSKGSIFFKPEIFSVLDEAHFEDVNNWVTQNLIKDSLTSSLARYFPALNIVHNGLKFIYNSRNGSIDVQIIAEIDGETKQFNASLHKGVKAL